MILLALIQGFFVCDGRAMALMICEGVLYAARKLEFLVKAGWLPMESLAKCGLSWMWFT